MSTRAAYEQAVRQAEAQRRRQIEAFNREQQRRIDEYNRQVDQHNRQVEREVDAENRRRQQHNERVEREQRQRIDAYNKHIGQVNAQNAATITELNRRLRVAESGPRYTPTEQALADRVHDAVVARDDREWDIFLSYARIDGEQVGDALRRHLDALGVRVWFDEITIVPGQSQSLQMDRGLQKARAGLVLLTPAYVAGRFWTERELGALLHKETLIPVLHGVTFDQVAEYSGILPDLAGFETSNDSVEVIAQKIAAAVLAD
ncbi:MAG TPA: TIR domain-containing protein [Solirubrobacteraceae bacterium]|nr:TIR domain-containing protein [Solirubrobacteraceae bacterium]